MPDPTSVETCVAAAISGLRQPEFSGALWALCGALAFPDNLIVMAYRDAGAPLVLMTRAESPMVFARLEEGYLAGSYRLDPYYALHLARVADGAYRIWDIAPDAFQRSRYFTEYYSATTLIDEIAVVAGLGEGVSLNVCLGRDARSGRQFGVSEVAAFRRFAPVLAALARAEWRGIAQGAGQVEDTPALLVQAAGRRGIRLSPRQANVALLILRGHSSQSIALLLGVSPQTVKVFRKQLYARCAITSQAELFTLMLPMLKAGGQPSMPALGRGSEGNDPVAR